MHIQHKKLNFLIDLRTSKKTRNEVGKVLIAGEKMVKEIAKSCPIETLIVQDESQARAFSYKELLIAKEAEIKKITGLLSPEPVAAVFSLPKTSDLSNKKKLLILDAINDPGNLGTLIRTALALGMEGVIFTENTVDPFNDKSLRAAKGATFHLPFAFMSKKEVLAWSEEKAISLFVADLQGDDVSNLKKIESFALILGNESHGPDISFKQKAKQLHIPISQDTDSLNVAVAGAILMYTLLGAS